jgi:hypothetical protein
LADIAIGSLGAATAAVVSALAPSGPGVVPVYMQPARVLAAQVVVADNDRVRPNVGGPNKEQTFRSGRDLRRNGLSPMIVGR